MRSKTRKLKKLVRELVKSVATKVAAFFKGVYEHAEAVTILVLSSIGLNVLFGELPFYFILPLWIEQTMVIPVISVVGILLLLKASELRATRRYA